MAKIYVDLDSDETINEIAWFDKNGNEELIKSTCDCIKIVISNNDSVVIYKEDIPKLQRALEKAKELGWF